MKWKKKGEVLSLALIILMCLLAALSPLCLKVIHNAKAYKEAQNIRTLRYIENAVCGYMLYSHYHNMLFSEYVSGDDFEIYYTADDMGDEYLIDCVIQYQDIKKSYTMFLVKETNIITDFRNLS